MLENHRVLSAARSTTVREHEDDAVQRHRRRASFQRVGSARTRRSKREIAAVNTDWSNTRENARRPVPLLHAARRAIFAADHRIAAAAQMNSGPAATGWSAAAAAPRRGGKLEFRADTGTGPDLGGHGVWAAAPGIAASRTASCLQRRAKARQGQAAPAECDAPRRVHALPPRMVMHLRVRRMLSSVLATRTKGGTYSRDDKDDPAANRMLNRCASARPRSPGDKVG